MGILLLWSPGLIVPMVPLASQFLSSPNVMFGSLTNWVAPILLGAGNAVCGAAEEEDDCD